MTQSGRGEARIKPPKRARVRPILLLVLGIAASVMAACGTANFDGMLVEEPSVVEISSNSATIAATTADDTVCAIAFGPTTDYGRVATDLDMSSEGHQMHRPVLTGLQPDTLYHFKFGGIGPDGTVFESNDRTFRTLPEDPSAMVRSQMTNLALISNGARVVAASSVFGGDEDAWGPDQAIDGNPSTHWATQGDGDSAWIEIELADETSISEIGFWSRTMGTTAQIFTFRVVTDRGETYGPFDLTDASTTNHFPVEFTAKRLKFEAVKTSGSNTGAVEIEVYGPPR